MLRGRKKNVLFTVRRPPPPSGFEVYFFYYNKKNIMSPPPPWQESQYLFFFIFLFFYQNCSQYPKTYNKHIKLYPHFLWYTLSYFGPILWYFGSVSPHGARPDPGDRCDRRGQAGHSQVSVVSLYSVCNMAYNVVQYV